MIRYECGDCGELAQAEAHICPEGCINPVWTRVVLDDPEPLPEPLHESESEPDPGVFPDRPASSPPGTPPGTPGAETGLITCPRCSMTSPAGSERCAVCGVGFETPTAHHVSEVLVPPPPIRPSGLLVGLLGRPDVPAVTVPSGGAVEIGRAAGPFAPFLEDFRNVSRVHAELRLDGAECTVRDLDSTNGTFLVDAARIIRLSANHWHTVVEGRRLQLGNRPDLPNATLEFTWGDTP